MTAEGLRQLGKDLTSCLICGAAPAFIGVYIADNDDDQRAMVERNRHRRDVIHTPHDGLAYALCADHPPSDMTGETVEAVLMGTWVPMGAGKSAMIH